MKLYTTNSISQSENIPGYNLIIRIYCTYSSQNISHFLTFYPIFMLFLLTGKFLFSSFLRINHRSKGQNGIVEESSLLPSKSQQLDSYRQRQAAWQNSSILTNLTSTVELNPSRQPHKERKDTASFPCVTPSSSQHCSTSSGNFPAKSEQLAAPGFGETI